MSDHLAVMNQGKFEEYGNAEKVFSSPSKEYTQKLINSIYH
jgi:peptide/nickel transport system ATP-binding protein